MQKFKIGVTERGDAAVHSSEWIGKTSGMDAVIAITKGITPELSKCLLMPGTKEKTILHATITGYGGTLLEPGAPTLAESHARINELMRNGFPAEQIVLRIDPIIPTDKGLALVESILRMFQDTGITRVRFSFLQYYRHAEVRFKAAGLSWPTITDEMKDRCFLLFAHFAHIYTFQSCAGSVPFKWSHVAKQTGCVSDEDIDILGLAAQLQGLSHQRPACLCCSGKTELLAHRKPCKHGCKYCYWVG